MRGRTCKSMLRLFASVFLLVSSTPAFVQETRYVYDALGRLIAVVDSQGRTTLYEYDPVGNILAIRRSDTTDPVEITLVNPDVGPAGTTIEILGFGFSEIAAENEVRFNGTAASVLTGGRTRLTTIVPVGATSGLVTVTTPTGSSVSPDIFQVPAITISPAGATVIVGKTRQFAATLFDSPDPRLFWSVDGIEGGNEIVGTITTGGLYTAPAEVPLPATVKLRVSGAYATLFAEADVAIVPTPGFVIAGPADVRVVRPGTGAVGGLPRNVTIAGPQVMRVVRPGAGDAGGLSGNVVVAEPHFVAVTRPGTGDTAGLPSNVTIAAPPTVTVVRPGSGDSDGLPENVTIARPEDVKVKRQ